MIRKEEYPKELFSLIIEYAKKKSEISGLDLIETIKNYTPTYYLIGNHDWEFKEESIYWKEFIKRYEKGEDLVELIYNMYTSNYEEYSKHKWFGCFRYRFVEDEDGNGIVKMHFLNDRTSSEGPLSSSQKENRLKELKKLFEDVKRNHPNTKYVQGGSWLYNLESYRRLFPKEYTNNMKSIHPKPQMLVIWGQFINSEWEINQERAERFLERLEKCKTDEDLQNVFELVELFPRCEIGYFYDFYSQI
ncbi:MAG: hypothetical protein ACOX0X_02835 [Candidatus Dojkabacteria bacterium]